MTSLAKEALEFFKRTKEELIQLSYQPSVFQETRNEEKIYALTRELVNAQFQLCDDELTNRLWEEVADLNLDPERIINLMYKCHSHDNFTDMFDIDSQYFTSSFEIK